MTEKYHVDYNNNTITLKFTNSKNPAYFETLELAKNSLINFHRMNIAFYESKIKEYEELVFKQKQLLQFIQETV